MTQKFIGSKYCVHVFASRRFSYKVRYGRNVLAAFIAGRITASSCWQALRHPYVALVGKTGSEMVLVCPSAVEIKFSYQFPENH